jgi:hypothetical protein
MGNRSSAREGDTEINKSHPDDDLASYPQNRARLSKRTVFYAELISEKALPADLPAVKVLINDRIASSAVDQLRDSEMLAQKLAKEVVFDLLNDRHSPERLGTLLKYVFSYESLLQPARDLLYWSLHLPQSYGSIYWMSKQSIQQMGQYEKQALASISQQWLLRPETRIHIITPLLICSFLQQANVALTLSELATATLPLAKVQAVYPSMHL